jgi:hypothetical protein
VLNSFIYIKISFGCKEAKKKNAVKAKFSSCKKIIIPHYKINGGGHFVEDEHKGDCQQQQASRNCHTLGSW